MKDKSTDITAIDLNTPPRRLVKQCMVCEEREGLGDSRYFFIKEAICKDCRGKIKKLIGK